MAKLLDLLKPDMITSSVAAVDLNELEKRGIRGLLLDIDNTLVAWRKVDVPAEVRQWIQEARRRGFGMCLASNTRNNRRLEQLARDLQLNFVKGIVKPRREGLNRAMAAIGTTPPNTAVIGDQIFTDVLGGNRTGLLTILVRPIGRREFIATRISRALERLLFWFLRRRGESGTIPDWQASDRQGRE